MITHLQISQAWPRATLPFTRVIGTVLYTGVVGSVLNVRYIEPGKGGPVEDLQRCADMMVGEPGANRYILSIFWSLYNV